MAGSAVRDSGTSALDDLYRRGYDPKEKKSGVCPDAVVLTEKGTEKYDAIVNRNILLTLNTVFRVSDVRDADPAAKAEEYLTQDLGLSAEKIAALKAKPGPDNGSLEGVHPIAEESRTHTVLSGKYLHLRQTKCSQ